MKSILFLFNFISLGVIALDSSFVINNSQLQVLASFSMDNNSSMQSLFEEIEKKINIKNKKILCLGKLLDSNNQQIKDKKIKEFLGDKYKYDIIVQEQTTNVYRDNTTQVVFSISGITDLKISELYLRVPANLREKDGFFLLRYKNNILPFDDDKNTILDLYPDFDIKKDFLNGQYVYSKPKMIGFLQNKKITKIDDILESRQPGLKEIVLALGINDSDLKYREDLIK